MKLATQLSLLLVAALAAAVLAMAAFFAFNLERGFTGYINALQARQVDALVEAAAQLARVHGGLEPLLDDRRLWQRLVRETEGGQVPGDIAEWRAGPPMGGPRGGMMGPRDGMGRGPGRFVLLDAERRPFGERRPLPPPPGAGPPIDRAIELEGRVVGYVRQFPVERAIRTEDLAFLRAQFSQAAFVGLGVLLLGLIAAPIVARHWSRPLRDIGAATERISQGQFAVRVQAGGSDEIAALGGHVNRMAESLGRLEESRRRWIAESAHELRTPLMVLQGEIDALIDGVRPVDAAALRSLAEETRHLAKLTNDLHLLAVADLEGLAITPSAFDAAAAATRVVERFKARASERGLALSIVARAAPLEADPDRFEQLVANLLENSLRYTDAPGRIEVDVSCDASGVRMSVSDTAPSVSAAECERLFEPLHRVDAARSRREGGSGLGLAICRAIVLAHRGRISARPSSLGGLQVEAVFPA